MKIKVSDLHKILNELVVEIDGKKYVEITSVIKRLPGGITVALLPDGPPPGK